MTSKKSGQSQLKRTSHYYKKKLSTQEQDSNVEEDVKKVHCKIQKKPKEAKLRAKEARQRKKKYIERLQEKIESLERQLQTYRKNPHLECKVIQSQNSAFVNLNNNNKIEKQNQISQNNIKEKSKKNPAASEFAEEIVKLEGIQSAFRRLYVAVNEKNQNEAIYSVNVLREHFGVAGKERKNWIKELLLKMVDIQMPLHCRLLLEHCENRQQFYKLLGGSESLRQFRKVYFDQNAISTICQSRSAMLEIKQQYKRYFLQNKTRILLQLEQLSHEMFEQASKLQSQINKIEGSMSSLFVGRILVNLDIERRETQNLQQIFPVNFYKKSLIECPQHRETMKFQCDIDLCKQRDQERLERLSMMSQEENFLKDFFSD